MSINKVIPLQVEFKSFDQKLKTLASAARSIKCGPPSRTILEMGNFTELETARCASDIILAPHK